MSSRVLPMVLGLAPLRGHAGYPLKSMDPGWVKAASDLRRTFLIEQFLRAKSLGGLRFFWRTLQPRGAAARNLCYLSKSIKGLPFYSVPLAFRSPLIYRQESARSSSLLAFENIISPAFATI